MKFGNETLDMLEIFGVAGQPVNGHVGRGLGWHAGECDIVEPSHAFAIQFQVDHHIGGFLGHLEGQSNRGPVACAVDAARLRLGKDVARRVHEIEFGLRRSLGRLALGPYRQLAFTAGFQCKVVQVPVAPATEPCTRAVVDLEASLTRASDLRVPNESPLMIRGRSLCPEGRFLAVGQFKAWVGSQVGRIVGRGRDGQHGQQHG